MWIRGRPERQTPGIRENSTVGIAEGGRNDEGLESEAVAGRAESEAVAGRDGAVTRGKGANGETERRARGDGIGAVCGAGVEILGENTAEWGKRGCKMRGFWGREGSNPSGPERA